MEKVRTEKIVRLVTSVRSIPSIATPSVALPVNYCNILKKEYIDLTIFPSREHITTSDKEAIGL